MWGRLNSPESDPGWFLASTNSSASIKTTTLLFKLPSVIKTYPLEFHATLLDLYWNHLYIYFPHFPMLLINFP